MGSAKQQTAITKVTSLLQEWDKGSKITRRQILEDFIAQNENRTGPEIEAEFSQAASLFLCVLSFSCRASLPLAAGVLRLEDLEILNDVCKYKLQFCRTLGCTKIDHNSGKRCLWQILETRDQRNCVNSIYVQI